MRLFLILFFAFCFQMVSCRTIHVGKKQEIQSIKQGIALAKNNDTLYVHPGIYKEGNIIIDKSIVFLGIGYPILDGQKKFEVLSVKASNVMVQGFKLVNSGHAALDDPCAVKVYNQSNVQIINNKVLDNFFGIYIQNGNDCMVKGNVIVSNGTQEQLIGNGIHCWKSTNLKIIGNKIKGHRDGIYFEFVTNSVIWRNSSTHNVRYGLHFMFSNDDSYITNIFAHNGAGVAVMFTKNVKMFNNYFQENWGDSAYGLLLKEISDSYIFNNKFSQNTSGIYMEGTTRVKVEKNVFEANGWGMKIQASCMDNEVTANNFVKNTFDISTNGSLVLNTFNSNYWDKYEGYDLNKDGIGDVPYHPLSLFAVLTENTPSAMLLYRSFMITLLDKSEKVLPSITPDNFEDKTPLMKIMPL
ncbi:nitrous oxide reductase family maturation protein NosD [Flavobacterium hankyongi]